jgi:hypothetical protein
MLLLIGYGVPNPQFVKRNAVEVHPDGSIALELSLPRGVLAYRVYKFPWKESVQPISFTHFEVKEGNTYSYNNDSITTGIDIAYTSLSAADYNESIITRLSYGPVNPEFIDDFVDIISVSIIYEGLAIDAQNAEFRFDLATFPEIKDPENTMIYYRPIPGQGLFIPISTGYDTVGNELNATLNGFGEIVFGVTMQDTISNVPILYEPLNQQKLVLQDSITVRWTGKGFYHSFNIQVSTDSTFTTMLHEANTNHSDFSMSGLANNTTYFWRVNSVLNSKSSEWSQVWSFEIADPFIRVVTPNGGEIWTRGDREIINWETNILEKVHIDLLQDDFILFSLDTIQGSHQAMAWNIPANLQPGDNYKIQIMSESNTDLSGISENVFSIKDTLTGILESENLATPGYGLFQNFPNPFNMTTKIRYSIQKAGFVILQVYDLTGRKIQILVNEFQESGTYSIPFKAHALPSGIYFYKLRVENEFMGFKKMQLVR